MEEPNLLAAKAMKEEIGNMSYTKEAKRAKESIRMQQAAFLSGVGALE